MSDNYNHKTPQIAANQDEIDVIDLINTLWAQKFLILIIAAVGFCAAYGLSLLQTEQWRSTSVVVAPRLADTENLLAESRSIQRITNPDEDIDIDKLLQNVFATFLFAATDNDNKKQYLEKTELFQRLQQGSDANAEILLNNLSQNLSVQVPNDENLSLTTNATLTFISDTAKSAQEILNGYVDHINNIAIKTVRKEFYNELNAQITKHKQLKEDLEREVKATRQISITNYSNALLIAQKAGIKSNSTALAGLNNQLLISQKASNNIPGRTNKSNNELVFEINPINTELLYLQGEEILTALLHVAKNSPLTYPIEYYRLQYEIEALESLQDKQPEFQSFSYLMRPTIPTKRSSPKRAQMAVIGGVVGGVLACLFVLIMAAFRNREKSLAQN